MRLTISEELSSVLAGTLAVGFIGALVGLAFLADAKDKEYLENLKSADPDAYAREMVRRREAREEAAMDALRNENPEAAAIKAIGNTAMSETSDFYKYQACLDIFKLAQGGDDKVLTQAIEEIQRIAGSIESGYYKHTANDLIKTLIVMKQKGR